MSEIEYVISVICIAMTFIVYIIVSRSIYMMRKGTITVRPRELKLLAHAAILFVTLTSLITCWHYYQAFLPDTKWTLFSINNYWILYCGMNPILCMIFSRKMRLSCLHPLRRQKTSLTRVTATRLS
ncbi:unnamed protein product [Cylicocyclus nassatus]|uniref:Uncharacterized protein n=1 Tax=Cylicocyclus nassatus TaxID=53992 RepID=A0AA36DJF1_CYLNA|nr:unnamed protein product [Cylicocyclus nassatus]